MKLRDAHYIIKKVDLWVKFVKKEEEKKKLFVKEILFDYESVIFYLHLSYLRGTPFEEV